MAEKITDAATDTDTDTISFFNPKHEEQLKLAGREKLLTRMDEVGAGHGAGGRQDRTRVKKSSK